jgi:hypothetical protein
MALLFPFAFLLIQHRNGARVIQLVQKVYGLDDQGIRVQFFAGAGDVSDQLCDLRSLLTIGYQQIFLWV